MFAPWLRSGGKHRGSPGIEEAHVFKMRRVYLPPESGDGFRVLVDRLWPRGLTKDAAKIDLWLKEIAPSDGLRKWFGHDPERWEGFAQRYRKELEGMPDLLAELRRAGKEHATVTLLFGAKDEARNDAVVLLDALRGKRAASRTGTGARTKPRSTPPRPRKPRA
jgi:uncharacterized protein YeaO (DUF488 family)